MRKVPKIAYIFTTFPAKSETFLQREIECIQEQEATEISLFSLWGGSSNFKGIAIHLFQKYELAFLPWLLVKLGLKHPKRFLKGLRASFTKKPTSFLNIGENLVGLAFALRYYRYFQVMDFDLIHATWATMPATAALVISQLTNIPFSMGAHAYDIFKDGGDTYLKSKIKHSAFVHTSSINAKNRLQAKGAQSTSIAVIRRGLSTMPEVKKMPVSRNPLKIISIGRLVEKKGFLRQLEIYKYLKDHHIPFQAKIVGEGELKEAIIHKIKALNLTDVVELLPWMHYYELEELHDWANAFLFTGIVAGDGDRDGLPNVIPEVMAKGVPVVSSNVSAIPEVIATDQNGIIIEDYKNNQAWAEALKRLAANNDFYLKLTTEARKWVETHYNGHTNAKRLMQYFKEAIS